MRLADSIERSERVKKKRVKGRDKINLKDSGSDLKFSFLVLCSRELRIWEVEK